MGIIINDKVDKTNNNHNNVELEFVKEFDCYRLGPKNSSLWFFRINITDGTVEIWDTTLGGIEIWDTTLGGRCVKYERDLNTKDWLKFNLIQD